MEAVASWVLGSRGIGERALGGRGFGFGFRGGGGACGRRLTRLLMKSVDESSDAHEAMSLRSVSVINPSASASIRRKASMTARI